MLKVAEVMQDKVVTISYEASVRELSKLLEEKGISGVPVVDADGRLVGVASRTDIGSGLTNPPLASEEDEEPGSFYDEERDDLRGFAQARVGDIMTEHVVTVDPEDPVSRLIDIMDRDQIHRVFVTRGDEVVGVVSTMDLVRAFKRQLEQVTA